MEEKGVADFVSAVAELKETRPDVTAVIVGEGQSREQLESEVKSRGLAQQITFTGWIQPEEIPVYLAAADVFVGPSRRGPDGWVEAQGLTFIEAMVARTPVVATRSGGIVDSVIDGETGLLVDERSPEQITQAILRLLNDRSLQNKISERAYARAVEKFSKQASANAFSSLFTTLLSQHSHANDG